MNYTQILFLIVCSSAQSDFLQCMEKNPAPLATLAKETFIQHYFISVKAKSNTICQGLSQLNKAPADIVFPLFDRICDSASPTFISGQKKISKVDANYYITFLKGFIRWATQELEGTDDVTNIDLRLSQLHRFPYFTCNHCSPETILRGLFLGKKESILYKKISHLFARHNPLILHPQLIPSSSSKKLANQEAKEKVQALIDKGHCFDGVLSCGNSILPFLIKHGFLDASITLLSSPKLNNGPYLANLIGKPSNYSSWNSPDLQFAHPIAQLIKSYNDQPTEAIICSIEKLMQLGCRTSVPQGSNFIHPLISLIQYAKEPEDCAEISPLLIPYSDVNWHDHQKNTLLHLCVQEKSANKTIVLTQLLKLPFDRNMQNAKGHTVLHTAVNANDSRAVEYLIFDGKVDPFIVDEQKLKASQLGVALRDSTLHNRLIEYEASFGQSVQKN